MKHILFTSLGLMLLLPVAQAAITVTDVRETLAEGNVSLAQTQLDTVLANDPDNVEAGVLRAITRLALLTATPETKAIVESHLYGTVDINASDWTGSSAQLDSVTDFYYINNSDPYDGTDCLVKPLYTYEDGEDEFVFTLNATAGDTFSFWYNLSPLFENSYVHVTIDGVIYDTLYTFDTWTQYTSPALTTGSHEIKLLINTGYYIYTGSVGGNYHDGNDVFKLDVFNFTGAPAGMPTGATIANGLDYDGIEWPPTTLLAGDPAVRREQSLQPAVDYLAGTVRNAVTASIADLALYADDTVPYVSVYESELTGQPIVGGGVETRLDYGDVLMLRCLLQTLCAAIDTVASYDWDNAGGSGLPAESYELYFLLRTQIASLEQLLDTYPDLLNLLAEQRMDVAGTAMDTAIARYDEARAYILGYSATEREDRLFVLPDKERAAESDIFAELRQYVPGGTSVKAIQIDTTEDGTDFQFVSTPIFSGAFNPHAHMPAFHGNLIRLNGREDGTTVPDTTFAGVADGISEVLFDTKLLDNRFGASFYEDWLARFGLEDTPEAHRDFFRGIDPGAGNHGIEVASMFRDSIGLTYVNLLAQQRDQVDRFGYGSAWEYRQSLEEGSSWSAVEDSYYTAFARYDEEQPLITRSNHWLYFSYTEPDEPMFLRQKISWPDFDGDLTGVNLGFYDPDYQDPETADIICSFQTPSTGTFVYDGSPVTVESSWKGNRLTLLITFTDEWQVYYVFQFTTPTSGTFNYWDISGNGLLVDSTQEWSSAKFTWIPEQGLLAIH